MVHISQNYQGAEARIEQKQGWKKKKKESQRTKRPISREKRNLREAKFY